MISFVERNVRICENMCVYVWSVHDDDDDMRVNHDVINDVINYHSV